MTAVICRRAAEENYAEKYFYYSEKVSEALRECHKVFDEAGWEKRTLFKMMESERFQMARKEPLVHVLDDVKPFVGEMTKRMKQKRLDKGDSTFLRMRMEERAELRGLKIGARHSTGKVQGQMKRWIKECKEKDVDPIVQADKIVDRWHEFVLGPAFHFSLYYAKQGECDQILDGPPRKIKPATRI